MHMYVKNFPELFESELIFSYTTMIPLLHLRKLVVVPQYYLIIHSYSHFTVVPKIPFHNYLFFLFRSQSKLTYSYFSLISSHLAVTLPFFLNNINFLKSPSHLYYRMPHILYLSGCFSCFHMVLNFQTPTSYSAVTEGTPVSSVLLLTQCVLTKMNFYFFFSL